MKYQVFLLLILGFTLFACNNDDVFAGSYLDRALDRLILTSEEMNINGKVKAIFIQEYQLFGDPKKAEIPDEKVVEELVGKGLFTLDLNSNLESARSFFFDKEGRLKKSVELYKNEAFYEYSIEHFVFDKTGRLIEINYPVMEAPGYTKDEFVYDRKNRLIQLQELDIAGDIKSFSSFEYIADTILEHRIVINGTDTTWNKKERYDWEGNIIPPFCSCTEEFDEKGNLIIRVNYQDSTKLKIDKQQSFEYDPNNNLINESLYDSLGRIEFSISYFYNTDGELIRSKELDSNGGVFKSYNKFGQVKDYESFSFNSDGSRSYKFVWDNYDTHGNMTKEVLLERSLNGELKETIRRYQYDYDSNGNWINKYHFINDTLKTHFERQIIYY